MEFSVKEYDFPIVVASGKSRILKACQWKPEGEPTAIVFVTHGYGERLRPYYDAICEAGARLGILCVGHDHVGHGTSQGERVQVLCMSEYVEPVLQHCRQIKQEYSSLPLFILGHSMGGLITLLSVLKDREQETAMVKGMVLVGPLVQPDPKVATPLKVLAAKIASNVLPGFALGAINVEDVTSDEEWREHIKKDDLRWHGGFKARHSHVLLTRLKELEGQLAKVDLPFLILHGAEDAICTVSGSKQLEQQAASKDKQLLVLEGSRHNLFLEKESIRSTTTTEIWKWIQKRI